MEVTPEVISPAEDLILTQPDKEEEADSLLASLSTLAFAAAPEKPKAEKPTLKGKPVRDFKSRFFFTIEPSFAAEIRVKKKQFKPKALDHIDAEVEERLVGYKEELPADLKANIELVREFFLTELAPLTLAGTAGTSQAREVIQRLLGVATDNTAFDRYERMMRVASNIQTARFIARFMGLPRSYVPQLMATLEPRAPVTFAIPPGQAPAESGPAVVPTNQAEPRHLRNRAAKQTDMDRDQ